MPLSPRGVQTRCLFGVQLTCNLRLELAICVLDVRPSYLSVDVKFPLLVLIVDVVDGAAADSVNSTFAPRV